MNQLSFLGNFFIKNKKLYGYIIKYIHIVKRKKRTNYFVFLYLFYW